jgi:hypothetical protein
VYFEHELKKHFHYRQKLNNIDEVFSEFQGRDIEFADTLRTHPYGLREFSFIDINGYYIRVAESTEEE